MDTKEGRNSMTNPSRKRNDSEEHNKQEKEELERNQKTKKRQDAEENTPERRTRGGVNLTPVDSYTGETLPPEPAGDIPIEDMQVDSYANITDYSHLEEDKAMDFIFIDRSADDDPIRDQVDDFTEDPDIIDDFVERQNLSNGSSELYEKLANYNSKGPQLSGGDIDAAWESSDVSGEESVGGTSPTPDQDVVDDLGEAVGISYEDDEELNTEEKLGKRDRNRWELDPRSIDEEQNDLEGRDQDETRHQEELDDF
jgi:hypothetical protein